jgi:hypothetical protein
MAVADGGGIYTSKDSGTTWTQPSVPGTLGADWVSVASSSDGTKLVATSQLGIYTSADLGTTWTSNNIPAYFAPIDRTHMVENLLSKTPKTTKIRIENKDVEAVRHALDSYQDLRDRLEFITKIF